MQASDVRPSHTRYDKRRVTPGDHNALPKGDMSDTNGANAKPIAAVDREPTGAARAQEARPEAMRANGTPQRTRAPDPKNRFVRPKTRFVDVLDTWDMFCALLSHLPLASCAALRCAYKCYQDCSLIDILGDRLSQTTRTLFDAHSEYGTVVMRLTPFLKSKVPFWKMSIDVRATIRSTNKTHTYQLSTELGSFSKVGTLMWNPSNIIMVLAIEKLINECMDDPSGHSFTDRVDNDRFVHDLHLWASRWDMSNHGFDQQYVMKTKVTDFSCSNYPKTRFLESDNMFFTLKAHPFWSRFSDHDRYYAKRDNSTFAISTTPGLGRLDGVKSCHKNKLTPLDHILSTLKLTEGIMKTLCSFGLENALQGAIDRDKVDKVALAIKSFIKKRMDRGSMLDLFLAETLMNRQVFFESTEFGRYYIFD